MPDISPRSVRIENYDYNLPENKIARFPSELRTGSKLLLYLNGKVSETGFENLPEFTGENKLIIFNDTRVIQARINMHKETGSKIEIFLLEPLSPSDYSLSFSAISRCRWKCMTGNKKKWKGGILEKKLSIGGKKVIINVSVEADHGSWQEIEFSWTPAGIPFSEIIENAGLTPIPPYLNRVPEEIDRKRYQTVYSRFEGSVAAPTAGLHFTEELLDELKRKGNQTGEITLHVGAGTFQPVRAGTMDEHSMHTEHFSVTAETIDKLRKHEGEIISVGTTSARALESLYWLGVKQLNGLLETPLPELTQFEITSLPEGIPVKDSLQALSEMLEKNRTGHFAAKTRLMIIPGYRFRLVDSLITNFHQPKSTLLLLIAAFVGEDWRKIYDYALQNDFRFLSYGDSSLLIPSKNNRSIL